VYTDGVKVTGPIRLAIEEYWGRSAAMNFFDKKNIVSREDFDLIWWVGVRKVMAGYPKMFCIFITKQVSGWCGSNSKRSLWDTSISNVCPNCGLVRETSKHLTRCKHIGRVKLLHELIEAVVACLESASADPDLICTIETYLQGQGSTLMECCVPIGSGFLPMAQAQDRLGWDCFVEGRITTLLLECIRPSFVLWHPRRSLERWGVQFLKFLLSLTHKQWIYRNTDVHFKIDGLTHEEHLAVFSRIRHLMRYTSSDLLPCHQHLLDKNFHNLGNADTIQRQIWIASMESALKASLCARSRRISPESMLAFCRRRTSTTLQSNNQHSHTTNRPLLPPRHKPHQQMLPASFWKQTNTPLPHTTPPDTHNTDLTGTHFWLHWKRK
jgi:hypothetical protein